MIGRKVALPALLFVLVTTMSVSASDARTQSSSAKKKAAPRASSTKKPAQSTSGAHKTTTKTSSSKTPGKKGKRLRRQPGQKAPSADRISEIQAALAKDGSFAGTPNGKWDDSTVSAMKKYQAGHGLNPTGRLDAPTLQKLGLGSTTAGVAAPQTPPGAVSRLTSSRYNSADPSGENQQ